MNHIHPGNLYVLVKKTKGGYSLASAYLAEADAWNAVALLKRERTTKKMIAWLDPTTRTRDYGGWFEEFSVPLGQPLTDIDRALRELDDKYASKLREADEKKAARG